MNGPRCLDVARLLSAVRLLGREINLVWTKGDAALARVSELEAYVASPCGMEHRTRVDLVLERDAALARAEQAEKAMAEVAREKDDWVKALRADVGVWKGKAEQAERELKGANERGALMLEAKNHLLVKASDLLKQAERERDEARGRASELDMTIGRLRETRIEVAEVTAQCAAMREALEYALGWLNENTYPSAVSRARAALAPNAGHALLAELAALREVAEAARRTVAADGARLRHGRAPRAECDLEQALTKLDALKAARNA